MTSVEEDMEESLISNREKSRHTDCRSADWTATGNEPPPPLSVPEISISALECLVLQLETHLVRGGLSTEPFKEANASAKGQSNTPRLRSADCQLHFFLDDCNVGGLMSCVLVIRKIPFVQSTLSRRPRQFRRGS